MMMLIFRSSVLLLKQGVELNVLLHILMFKLIQKSLTAPANKSGSDKKKMSTRNNSSLKAFY